MGTFPAVIMRAFVLVGFLAVASALPNPEIRGSSCAKVPKWMKTAMSAAPAGDRIVGGSKAPKAIPWQVSIRNVQEGLDENLKPVEWATHFCGGTILDATTILSAAHCFPKNGDASAYSPEGKQIMAGSTDLQDKKNSQRIAFKSIVFNTKAPWDAAGSSNNDIVIIKLKSPLKFNENVQPACLPDEASFKKAQAAKQMSVVSGWGGLKDQGETPNDLQFVPVPLFPENLCGGFMDHGLSDGMICAGYKAGGKDPCQGDSGGPLVMASSDDTAVIIGAVSHGMGKCGEKEKPAIYARVTKYLGWIKANMGA